MRTPLGIDKNSVWQLQKALKDDYDQKVKLKIRALLKQGLSFLNLGDKSSARLILQQIIKDYPNTNQARIARAKLVEIK